MKSFRKKRFRFLGQRLRKAAVTGGAVWVFIIGPLSALKDFFQYDVTFQQALWTMVFVTLLSLLAGLRRARIVHLSDILSFGSPPNTVPPRCKICSREELEAANNLASPHYGSDSVSDELVLQWQMKNPLMYVCVLNGAGELDSSFGIMPLNDGFLDQFLAGHVIEGEIRPDDIKPPVQQRRASRLYISGVIVRDAGTLCGQVRTGILLWTMLRYLKKAYGTGKKRMIYALAATHDGENLLKGLGFKLLSPADKRRDKHNLYSLEFDRTTASKIEHRIPDYHPICAVELDAELKAAIIKVKSI